MTFKKFLKLKVSKKGQSALEYFILFAVVASVVYYGLSEGGPLEQIGDALQGRFFEKVVGEEGLNIGNE
jgi:hypothetical protein